MDIDEAPVIYGLELPARCMTNQPAESNVTRFFIGTQSLRQENQLHYVEFDDDNNMIDKTIFLHSCGEIWNIAASYADPNIVTTCYSLPTEKINMECGLWRIPVVGEDAGKKTNPSSGQQYQELEHVTNINTEEFGNVISTHWKPLEESSSLAVLAGSCLLLYDVGESRPQIETSHKLPDRKGHPCPITCGRWNPHHNGKHFAIASDQNVIGWDFRSKEQSYFIDCAHFQGVRDIDFNPNKMYDLVTCGDDCAIKFWDIRELDEPIKVLPDDHSHWVWSVRYNPFHDQLLLSGGSDSKVILHNQSSISSEPTRESNLSDEESGSEDSYGEERVQIEDCVIAKYEEHEDSVYAVEWSSADPWTFASLSYDGRLVINKVPKKVKFDILL